MKKRAGCPKTTSATGRQPGNDGGYRRRHPGAAQDVRAWPVDVQYEMKRPARRRQPVRTPIGTRLDARHENVQRAVAFEDERGAIADRWWIGGAICTPRSLVVHHERPEAVGR